MHAYNRLFNAAQGAIVSAKIKWPTIFIQSEDMSSAYEGMENRSGIFSEDAIAIMGALHFSLAFPSVLQCTHCRN